jgi:hypothetical protein
MVIYDFGGHGYEEMTLVQESTDFTADQAHAVATRIADAYEFGSGSRYADFRDGDKVAAISAGGLIAAALGVKFGKRPSNRRSPLPQEALVLAPSGAGRALEVRTRPLYLNGFDATSRGAGGRGTVPGRSCRPSPASAPESIPAGRIAGLSLTPTRMVRELGN